ncbi:acetyltransferase [Shewanella oncorhynchi]|uniref:acetyltransferase n=1 Tax=Shewanella oncorhynchi TaxID=2726434 RepID=UPI0039EE87E0
MTKPIIMVGSGGHASVLTEILLHQDYTLLAVVSPSKGRSPLFSNIQHFDSDDDILQFPCNEVRLVNGLGSLPGQHLRHKLFAHFTQLNYEFESVVSKHAMLSSYATVGAGAQILTGSIIQTGATIGRGTIINSGAIIEHDCDIGNDCHIAPGAIICGGVHIGERSHIATGANVIQGISIGKNCIIAAGSIVTKNMPDNTIIYGYRSKIEEKS